jgi:hypothetical protein
MRLLRLCLLADIVGKNPKNLQELSMAEIVYVLTDEAMEGLVVHGGAVAIV